MKRLVHETLFQTAEQYPRNMAVICDGQATTYAELISEIKPLSEMLVDGGLVSGDRVAVLLADKKDFLVACYAVMAAGGIAVPVHEGCAPDTVEEIARDCEPRFLVAGTSDLDQFPDLAGKLRTSLVCFRNGRSATGKESYLVSDERIFAGNGSTKTKDGHADNGAMILYTSGTSGKRKGVCLTHRNLMQASVNINAFMNIDGPVTEFVSVPLTHSFGFGRARCVFLVGGTLVFSNGMLNPVTMTHVIRENECDAISAVPSGIAMFFGRFEHLLSQIGGRIRFMEFGSAPMPKEHKLKLVEMFPSARICMHFGLTEASRSTFIEFHSERHKLETVGRASPNVELSILDPVGVSQAAGENGEIAVRGKHVTNSYWDNPELTEERISRDGWLRTGDFGFLDEDGYLHLRGRKDDMINMGGIKISPLEIEEPLRTVLPSVELCVVGYPDPQGIAGEIPVLCYETSGDRKIQQSELMDLLSTRVDRFKIPRLAVPLHRLPKTNNQKIKRQEVRQLVMEHLEGDAKRGVKV